MELVTKINKRLANHISELEEYGLLPINWHWHRDRITTLKVIDEELIEDIIELHNSHQTVGDTLQLLYSLLKKLHESLEKLLIQKNETSAQQKDEAGIVNKLIANIKQILDSYKTYGHLTAEEEAHYLKLYKEDTKNYLKNYKEWAASGKKGLQPINRNRGYVYIKRLWNQRVDRKFLQSIHTIHWGYLSSIKRVLNDVKRTHELSTMGYKKPPYFCEWMGGIGLLMKGWVTWAANSDARIGNEPVPRGDPRFRGQKYSHGDGIFMILNKETFIPLLPNEIRHNELLVDNWKPVAIVIDIDFILKSGPTETLQKEFSATDSKSILLTVHSLAQEHGLKLIDTNAKEITLE
jgi:hypothetical protein